MSFVVNLATEFTSIDPGSTIPIAFQVKNTGDGADHFEVTIEGIDQDWVSILNPTLTLGPGESVEENVLVRPHRTPESAAGNYPFTLKVRSLNSGESCTPSGEIEVRPFHQISMDCEPKRISIGGTRAASEAQLRILNLGNTEHTLQVFASSPEDRFNFIPNVEKITIGPGQERDVTLSISSKRKPFMATPRLEVASLSVRSVNQPNVAAYSQAQIEQHPLLPVVPTLIAGGLGLLAFAWYSARPREPIVEVFELSKPKITVGESVNVVFRVQGAKKVVLKSEDGNGTSFVMERGEWTYTPKSAGVYRIMLVAEGSAQARRQLNLTVEPAPTVPKPEILSFDVSPRRVSSGGQFTVSYRLNEHVAKATLQPMGYTIDPSKRSFSFPPSTLGPLMLELVVENTRGDRDSRKIQVEVIAKTRAIIHVFEVNPTEVPLDDARVTVIWSTEGTNRAVLKYEGKSISVDPQSGSQEIVLTRSGRIELVATDPEGRSMSKFVDVKVVERKAPTPETPPTENPTNTPPNDPAPTAGDTAGGIPRR